MEGIAAKVSTQARHPGVLSHVYPNQHIWNNYDYDLAFDKTQALWDGWETLLKWTSDADVAHVSGHSAFQYFEEARYIEGGVHYDSGHAGVTKQSIRERLQVSPAHMREYEPHTDYGSKALTILVPIAPGVSEPSRFHGYNGDATVRSLPWKINQAYMFRPTANHSWHSYVGGEADRYVLNINFLF
jgi:hypothetical protein